MSRTLRQSVIKIEKEDDRVLVRFPYNPECIKRMKVIKGRSWRPEGKDCLPVRLPPNVIANPSLSRERQSQVSPIPPLVKGDTGGFEDMRREFLWLEG